MKKRTFKTLGSGIPAGINIPNYNEVRQSDGFKNVNLGNRIEAGYKVSEDTKVSFVSEEDGDYIKKFKLKSSSSVIMAAVLCSAMSMSS